MLVFLHLLLLLFRISVFCEILNFLKKLDFFSFFKCSVFLFSFIYFFLENNSLRHLIIEFTVIFFPSSSLIHLTLILLYSQCFGEVRNETKQIERRNVHNLILSALCSLTFLFFTFFLYKNSFLS